MLCSHVQDYLQTLNKKPTKLSLPWDKFEELSDLSAVSDDESGHCDKHQLQRTAAAQSSSKFVKKRTEHQPPAVSQTHQPQAGQQTGDALGSVNARCSAVGKAELFAAKYSAGRVMTLPSDSDVELSVSSDEDVRDSGKQTGES